MARPRTGLSREKILDAAIDFVDEHGLAALSTRKLGAAMGVEGMTLYYYVSSKAELLDGMVERLLQRSMPALLAAEGQPWQEAVAGMARALRSTLLAHPAMLGVLATRPVNTPGAFRILESGLTVMRSQGMPLGRAMDLINAVSVFVIGHTLAEAGEPAGAPQEQADPAGYPNIAESFATGEGLDFDSRFEQTLDIIIRGYAAL